MAFQMCAPRANLIKKFAQNPSLQTHAHRNPSVYSLLLIFVQLGGSTNSGRFLAQPSSGFHHLFLSQREEITLAPMKK